MSNNTPSHSSITSTLVPEDQRIQTIEERFGLHFPFSVEPFVFNVAGHISSDYTGGIWKFHTLSNGGFWMHPECDQPALFTKPSFKLLTTADFQLTNNKTPSVANNSLS